MLQLEQIRRNLRQILKLTLPITTSFVAMGIMGIVDTMIVGNYQTDQLAYIGLANSMQFFDQGALHSQRHSNALTSTEALESHDMQLMQRLFERLQQK